MTTSTTLNAPQPLLSASSRVAAAVAIAAAMMLGVMAAEQASRQAVDSAMATFAPGRAYVTLPSVEIVGRRGQPVAPSNRSKAMS